MIGDIIIGCGGVYVLVTGALIVALCRAAGKLEPPPPPSEEESE